jgi:hypothetical protein
LAILNENETVGNKNKNRAMVCERFHERFEKCSTRVRVATKDNASNFAISTTPSSSIIHSTTIWTFKRASKALHVSPDAVSLSSIYVRSLVRVEASLRADHFT